MTNPTSRRSFLFTTLGVGLLAFAGCDSKKEEAYNTPPPAYEGQYKNSKGEVVLEIKGGKIFFTSPTTRQKAEATFSEVEENKLMVEDSTGTFTMKFEPPDTITGLPASIARASGPLKKAS